MPRVRQAVGAGAQAVVVESISESGAPGCAAQDRCSGWQCGAVPCSRRGPRGPPRAAGGTPAAAEQTCPHGGAAVGSLQTFEAVALPRRWEMPLRGCSPAPAAQHGPAPKTPPSPAPCRGASAAVGALRREPPARPDTVTHSQKDAVGRWGDPGAFGYLGTLSSCSPTRCPPRRS